MDSPVKTILIHLLFCLHSTKFASLHENPIIYYNLRLFSDILHLLILRVCVDYKNHLILFVFCETTDFRNRFRFSVLYSVVSFLSNAVIPHVLMPSIILDTVLTVVHQFFSESSGNTKFVS